MSDYEDLFAPGGSVASEARDGVISAAIAAGKFPESRRSQEEAPIIRIPGALFERGLVDSSPVSHRRGCDRGR